MAKIDRLLEETGPQHPRGARRRKRDTPPLIAAWKKEERTGGLFRMWARGQVAAYRIGLVLGYLSMIYFGTSAFIAGVPTFDITAPRGWTPIWSVIVVVGGLTAAIGAIRAGTEPVTREIRIFNRIELGGAIALFLTLGTYAVLLLILGYGFGDAARAASGAGFMALGVHPAVRMVWLIFRPRATSAERGQ
jgi:hypothetical protein